MCAIQREYLKDEVVDSQLGKRKIDSEGAPISGIRMDASRAYAGIPVLLQKVINENDMTAWVEIANKIDYIYNNIDCALTELDRETGFSIEVRSQINLGKKLLFKPNLVTPDVIDHGAHGEGSAAIICTEWPMIAALMRWFHDKLDISYHQMALGEAASLTFFIASMLSKFSAKTITTEAVFEGRSGDFYGGWGFYFVRRYLGERHPSSHIDNPMNGYEDSVIGNFLPPGRANDRLMVYDLNKVQEGKSRGRTVPVPDGANFKEITLHKVVVGGDPANTDDIIDYPGCILVNVPKSKIHAQDLITNAIKNLGIGLYPTQCAFGMDKNDTFWKYSCPNTSIPSMKAKLPHSPWVLKMDDETNLPTKDENGKYIATKTAGFPGTQVDIIKAVQNQNVFMLHVVDAINAINISHDPDGKAVRVPEGYVWSSLDCVALDLFWARYLFKTVPMREALRLKEENGWPTEFVHHVPVAAIEGKNIATVEGLDSPLFRYNLYRYAEERGVGSQKYHIVGWDSLTETQLASLEGHLGRIDNSKFIELMTTTMYYNPCKILHDLQRTILSYAKVHDSLVGSELFKQFMDNFDENNDGIIDYDEMGRSGMETAQFAILGYGHHIWLTEEYGQLKQSFMNLALRLKNSKGNWNPQGHDFAKEKILVIIAAEAFQMSQSEATMPDLFIRGMTVGNGMWPSWQTAAYSVSTAITYGSRSPENIGLGSLYGAAFQYADKALNGGAYTGGIDLGPIKKYFDAVSKGAKLLDFTLYVPEGYGSLEKVKIPNVEETDDPKKTWSAHFNGGKEIWW